MNTNPTAFCPKCLDAVPPDAPHGLCPACLGVALGDESSGSEDQGRAPGGAFGPYVLLHQAGRGGAGVVFRARDRRSQAVVALKILTVGRFASEAERDRFSREAQVVAGLQHPRIAPFVDLGEEDGQPYLAMRWIEGQSLAALVTRGLPSHDEAARIVRQTAEAIAHAHERGVIHRDLKPSNILIQPDDEVCVVDFGLARHLEQEHTLTRTGDSLGTPGYMPPEQCGGNPASVGPASDVYSLGSVLYFALTGRPPFLAATHHETVLQLLRDDPVPPRRLNPAIPRDLESICLKCLEKEPGRRYPAAKELVEELDRFLAREPIQARPIGPTARLWRWSRRHRVVTMAAALIAVLIAGFSWHNWRTVTELRNTAPALVALAESLMTAQKFPEALERVETALRLQPRHAGYLALKGNILLAQLRVEEARESYIEALSIQPQQTVALNNVALCDKLMAGRSGRDDLSLDALTTIYTTLLDQGRSAEAYAVSRHIEIADGRFLESLQSRLTAAGITNRLERVWHRPSGLRSHEAGSTHSTPGTSLYLQLELSDSTVADLSPLKGIPLQDLDLSHCPNLQDIGPLQGMPLVRLKLIGNKVSDLSPLEGMPIEVFWTAFNLVKDIGPLKSLRSLSSLTIHNLDVGDLNPLRGLSLDSLTLISIRATNLDAIRGIPLTGLTLSHLNVGDLRPLEGMKLHQLRIMNVPVSDISPLKGMPLRYLNLTRCPQLVDLSALNTCWTLETLILPPNASEIRFLRSFPNLKEISYSDTARLSPEKFWQAEEARNAARE